MKGANYHGVDPSTRSPTALFGSIMIEMNTFASSETGARCQDISIPINLLTEKQAFECDMQTEQTTNVGVLIDGYLFCKTIVSCDVSAAFVASQKVLIQFPDPFQTFNWTVTPDVWSDTPGENVALSHAFNERGAYGAIEDEELSLAIKSSLGLQLAGTKGRPTTVSFSATRSRYKESFDNQRSMGVGIKTSNYEQWGVQLSYQGVSPIVQTSLGTSQGFHVVSFEFVVEEAIYVNHWESFADPMTAVGTAGAFLLSALAIMRAVKAYMGYGIDLFLLRRSANGDGNASIPSDVAMRHAALVENRKAEIDKAHAKLVSETKEMMRLESMAVEGSGDVEMTGENPMMQQNSTVAKLEQEVKALKSLVHELVADRESGLTL